MTILDELAHGESVTVGVTAGKALVGHIEKGQVVVLLADLGDLLPLVGGRVDAGGVVGTGVEEDGGTGRDGLEVSNHAVEVEGDGLFVVVAVVARLEAGVLEDGLVVGPGRGGHADPLLTGTPALEEGGAEAEGARARNGLGDGDLVEDGRVVAVGELGGGGREVGDAGDAGVLLVQLALDDALLGLANGGEDKGLAGVIAVGTDTEVDLLGVGVGLEGLRDT